MLDEGFFSSVCGVRGVFIRFILPDLRHLSLF
jgi:hypothetical protein